MPASDPFVGRTRELELLAEALTEVGAGYGRIVAVVGEPGIGKTRLAQEFGEQAREAGASVYWGRCQ